METTTKNTLTDKANFFRLQKDGDHIDNATIKTHVIVSIYKSKGDPRKSTMAYHLQVYKLVFKLGTISTDITIIMNKYDDITD